MVCYALIWTVLLCVQGCKIDVAKGGSEIDEQARERTPTTDEIKFNQTDHATLEFTMRI